MRLRKDKNRIIFFKRILVVTTCRILNKPADQDKRFELSAAGAANRIILFQYFGHFLVPEIKEIRQSQQLFAT